MVLTLTNCSCHNDCLNSGLRPIELNMRPTLYTIGYRYDAQLKLVA